MRWFLSLLVAIIVVSTSSPQPPKAAIALAKAKREREAICTSAECKAKMAAAVALLKAKRERESECMTDFIEAFKKSELLKMPLFLWVGMTCEASPEIRSAYPNAIHCHMDSLNGSSAPRLLVKMPGVTMATAIPRKDIPSAIKRIRSITNVPPSGLDDCGT